MNLSNPVWLLLPLFLWLQHGLAIELRGLSEDENKDVGEDLANEEFSSLEKQKVNRIRTDTKVKKSKHNNNIVGSSPWVEVRLFNNDQVPLHQIWHDRGSGADKDVSIWRPSCGWVWWDNSYWFSLGDVVGYNSMYSASGYNAPKSVLMMRAKNGFWWNTFRPASSYQAVWNDGGSGADIDATFWKPICPNNYDPLGYVASNGEVPPSYSQVCVVSHATMRGDVRQGEYDLIWDDAGSGAYADVTLLPADPTNGALGCTNLGQGLEGMGQNFKVCAANSAWCQQNPFLDYQSDSTRLRSVRKTS